MPERCWYLLSKKLSGEASHEEIAELRQLLASDASLAADVHLITLYWQSEVSSGQGQQLLENHLTRLRKAGYAWPTQTSEEDAPAVVSMPAWRRWTLWVGAAAAAVILLMVVWNWLNTNPVQAPAESAEKHLVATQPGSRTRINLPDGSEVWINADSKISYGRQFGRQNRELWLEGEAYFDVKKDVSLPFIIHTSRFKIKVTGTAFNVRAYPAEKAAETALIRGQIIVTLNKDSSRQYILKPTQKLRVDDQTGADLAPKAATARVLLSELLPQAVIMDNIRYSDLDSQAIETAWIKNRLEFELETFRTVADKMEHWYGVNIEFTDKQLEAEVLKGSFINETLEEALTYLSYTTKFNYTISGKDVIIKPKK